MADFLYCKISSDVKTGSWIVFLRSYKKSFLDSGHENKSQIYKQPFYKNISYARKKYAENIKIYEMDIMLVHHKHDIYGMCADGL